MATPAGKRPADNLLGRAIQAVSARDAAVSRWITQQDQQLRDAARAGEQTADMIVREQLNAGMTADQVDTAAEKVLGSRFEDPTPASDAFYDAYDTTAATYAADARDLDREAG